jgi:hypothetical protein
MIYNEFKETYRRRHEHACDGHCVSRAHVVERVAGRVAVELGGGHGARRPVRVEECGGVGEEQLRKVSDGVNESWKRDQRGSVR